MSYPIAISDTSGLDAPLVTLSKQPPVVRLAAGGAIGALLGSLLGHTVIGALVGAAGGYVAAAYIPKP